MKVLGIETSCDETSAAIVERRGDSPPHLLHQVIGSQVHLHNRFGGVVPEIACRSHVEHLTTVIEQCLAGAAVEPNQLSGIAVAHRPGLIGALLIGVTTAKSLAWAWQLPLLGVDHLEAHLQAIHLDGHRVERPYLGVVLSGGHTDIYVVEEHQRRKIGGTRDDAIGEAFDKVASILGLGYPGGPQLERVARQGDPNSVPLPLTLLEADSLDFSFSGIKTAVLYRWCGQNGKLPGPVPGSPTREDLAASFQRTVTEVVLQKLHRAIAQTQLRRVVFGGGVTANGTLRARLTEGLRDCTDQVLFPRLEFCTDNGAMIAAMGLEMLSRGEIAPLSLDAAATS